MLTDLPMVTPEPYSFQFQPQELLQKLNQTSSHMLTGYWVLKLHGVPDLGLTNIWYVALSQGRIVFSGNQRLSWQTLLDVLQRYIPRLQSGQAKQKVLQLKQELRQEQENRITSYLRLIDELQRSGFLDQDEVERAIYLKVVSDFDTHLFDYPGEAQFLPSLQLDMQAPTFGFNIDDLMIHIKERQAWWQSLSAQVPSMESIPLLNVEAVESANLTLDQQRRLQALVASGKTLNEIAVALAQDSLEIAKVFAKLINDSLVILSLPKSSPTSEIFVVDDSMLLLKQFEALVSGWGYAVRSCQDPDIALQMISQANPAVIFLDINMPGISGFDLVKQIRRQPKLEAVPLVMLTAEKTLANNWQARWSGCRFLSKPLTSHEIASFTTELRTLLAELVPSI